MNAIASSSTPSNYSLRTVHAFWAIATAVVLEALRGRLAWMLLLVAVVGFILSRFMASVAITETTQVSLLVLAAWLRLATAFVVGLFAVNSMVRDRVDKGMELVLSLPISRAAYVLGRWAGFCVCAFVAAGLSGVLIAYDASVATAFAWSIALYLELLLVVTMAVLCVLTLSQVPMSMCALAGFYVLSRSMSDIQLIATNPLVAAKGIGQPIIEGALSAIDWLLPDLDRFATSAWLMAPQVDIAELATIFVHGAIYLGLLLTAAVFDMQRKVL